ncbi:MAG: CHRD domain-containing protein [Chitinophagaceae bacterium]|nr:CHRD domain-containing protein [Chitinophagaceae bacterium]MCW5926030.1 CHRD domain-containing protein [Chitinophagaceae bacterium]
MKHFPKILIAIAPAILLFSCKDDDVETPDPTVVKEWNLTLSAKNEVPAAANDAAAGTAKLTLMSDNSLKYEFTVTQLATDDVLTMSHLHTGDAGSTGPVILPLAMSFTAPNASGIIEGLRQSLVDSLKSDDNEIYFNAHSQQSPAGIVRAQLNTNVEFAMDVALSSENEIRDSPIDPVATGTTILRLTSAKKLYSKVSVTGIADDDELTMAHIHTGDVSSNGPVYIMLCANKDDFDVLKITDLNDEQVSKVKTDALYVNAHSVNFPPGVARGQIR